MIFHGSCHSAEITCFGGLDLLNGTDQSPVSAGRVGVLLRIWGELVVATSAQILWALSLVSWCRWHEWLGMQKARQWWESLLEESVGFSIFFSELLFCRDRRGKCWGVERELRRSCWCKGWLEGTCTEWQGWLAHLWSELSSSIDAWLCSVD